MFKTLKNAWGIAELRKKLMFTLLILMLYRIGNVIPVPFIDTHQLSEYFKKRLAAPGSPQEADVHHLYASAVPRR